MLNHSTHIVNTSVFADRLLLPLKKEGVVLNKILRKHPLKNFDLTNPQGYVPQVLLYDFMLEIDRYLGPSGVCTLLYDHRNNYNIDELGDYGSHLLAAPNVFTMMKEATKHVKIMGTNMHEEFKILGNKASFAVHFIDPPRPGKELWEAVLFSIVLESFRSICGPSWVPLELQVPNNTANEIEKIFPRGDYHLSYGHPHYAVIFPVEILTLPPPAPSRPVGPLELENVEEKLAYRTEKLLLNYQPGQRASMTDFSDYFNLSTRSISRFLLEEGTTFSEIHDRVILLQALDLLSNPTLKIKEISEYLGYTEPANFNRFFKKRTGVSPVKFREIPPSI